MLWILLDAVGEPMLEPDVSSSDSLGELIGAGLASAAFLFAVQVLVLATLLVLSVVAVFLGAWLGRTVRKRNRQTFLMAGLSVTAGTAVLFGTVSVLLSVELDGLSLNAEGVLILSAVTLWDDSAPRGTEMCRGLTADSMINTVLTALFTGATAAGGAATSRRLFPGRV